MDDRGEEEPGASSLGPEERRQLTVAAMSPEDIVRKNFKLVLSLSLLLLLLLLLLRISSLELSGSTIAVDEI